MDLSLTALLIIGLGLISAFKSSGGRSMGGMPPAFIFAVGCLKSSASWADEILRSHRMAADFIARDSARFSIVPAEWPDVKRRLRRILDQA